MELEDFLRDRLDEDEAAAQAANDGELHTVEISFEPLEDHMLRWHPQRVLDEVIAKRAIIQFFEDGTGDADWYYEDRVFKLLAQPYRDHPNFQADWLL